MIKIDTSKEKSLDSALKKLKYKFANTKVKDQLFERQQFTKPSVERREVLKKARYKQELRSKEEKGLQ